MNSRITQWIKSAGTSASELVGKHAAIAAGAALAVIIMAALGGSSERPPEGKPQYGPAEQPENTGKREQRFTEKILNNIELREKNGKTLMLEKHFSANIRNGRGSRFPYKEGVFECDPEIVSLGSQVTLIILAGDRILVLEKSRVKVDSAGTLFIQVQYTSDDIRNKGNED